MKGTWREGSLAGDPEGYIEKALEQNLWQDYVYDHILCTNCT